jgi:hypothetical protein
MKFSLVKSVFIVLSVSSFSVYAADHAKFISKQEAIDVALEAVGGEVIGIRMDEPDNQWDVFVKSGADAFEVEVEVDAISGNVVASEKESLEEIEAELSGDLSHEGVSGDVDT